MWQEIGVFYKNPYSSDITQNILHNLSGIFHSTTLIYFGGLFAIILFARFLIKNKSPLSFLYTFIIAYGVLAFLYYLRSPGYLRYILIAELLILFITPYTVGVLVPWVMGRLKISRLLYQNIAVACVLGTLVFVQGVHLFTAADISSSDNAWKVASHIESVFPDRSLGLLNAPELGLFLNSSRTFLVLDLLGIPPVGSNPLFLEDPPDIIVSHSSDRFMDEERDILEGRYAASLETGGYVVFVKR